MLERYLGGLGSRVLVSATRRNLTTPHRLFLLRMLAIEWIHLSESRIPVQPLDALCPAIDGITPRALYPSGHYWQLPHGERYLLDCLIRYCEPSNLFEFGTFTGTTSCLMADAAPANAVVHTLDLPSDAFETTYESYKGEHVTSDIVGQEFRDNTKYDKRIVLHRSDSRRFDFTPFVGKMNFVFVDGSHDYDVVRSDSENALAMVAENGTIVWDDYQSKAPGVVRALNELAHDVALIRIASSRLVIHRTPSFPKLPLRDRNDHPNYFLAT
jgi:predicted O-methyltransferase YrrM